MFAFKLTFGTTGYRVYVSDCINILFAHLPCANQRFLNHWYNRLLCLCANIMLLFGMFVKNHISNRFLLINPPYPRWECSSESRRSEFRGLGTTKGQGRQRAIQLSGCCNLLSGTSSSQFQWFGE